MLIFVYDLLLGADLLTKFFAHTQLKEELVIIPGTLALKLIQNPNIAFSLPVPGYLITAATPLILGLVIWMIVQTLGFRKTPVQIATLLIAAGGIGNWVDRIINASVTDFIDFSFWPTFNLADSYLTIGVAMLLFLSRKVTKAE